MMNNKPIILASGSPRRHEILTAAGIPHIVLPTSADESLPAGISPANAVELLSARKAAACTPPDPSCVVLAADTVVCLNGTILGKPKDTADAIRMLQMLSGREHSVFTGITLQSRDISVTAHEETVVSMRPLTQEEIDAYVRSGEPMDKAGAYGIQGKAGLFVSGIRGDYQNVVGLPLCLTGLLLVRHFGYTLPIYST